VAFNLPGQAPVEVARRVGRHGIAVTAGHAYAQRLANEHLALPHGVVRASLLHYSNHEDVAALMHALAQD